MHAEKLVPDSTVVTDGLLLAKMRSGEVTCDELIIHEAMLYLLERNAREGKVSAFLGIAELEKLRAHKAPRFAGRKPFKEIETGELDSLCRELAHDEDAVLCTASKIQERLAAVKGTRSLLLHKSPKRILLEKFFDETTMSVHLRENALPFAKKGLPGDWQFSAIRPDLLTRDEIEEISTDIIEATDQGTEGFIEIERAGSTIVQLGRYRIVITRPPFSDGWEITAVRPVKKMELPEYGLSDKLKARLDGQAEGVLIAGSPGMGKSTFAAALAEYYAAKQKVVKTVEAPRDLVLPENITQYAISHGDSQEIHDILLLSRPDYTFFDEMRNTDDFKLFADLRLAGIGFIGVVHATKAIDAIQRFVGRIELGVIPQVVDTVIFIRNGRVDKVLSLQMLVKVPSGMTEADLARPVVVVNDFETRKPEFELYSYGEETVVVPVVGESRKSPISELARKQIEHEFRRYSEDARVEMASDSKCTVYVPEERIASIIGKQGKTISEIEQRLGISIDVKELSAGRAESGSSIPFNVKLGKSILFMLPNEYVDRDVTVVVNGDYLLTAKVSKSAQIKIKKNNKIARIISDAVNMGETVELIC